MFKLYDFVQVFCVSLPRFLHHKMGIINTLFCGNSYKIVPGTLQVNILYNFAIIVSCRVISLITAFARFLENAESRITLDKFDETIQ